MENDENPLASDEAGAIEEKKPDIAGTAISYEDFTKVDIRIGTIMAAEPVPETDKLIKCTVDFGESGIRTIVSGIKEYYEPEALVGKQCPYVINLASRMIRGVESQGMLFASSPHGGCVLLHPDRPVPPGTPTR
jgi:methionyl-tRNA synthetase